jgi:hypothetical protein
MVDPLAGHHISPFSNQNQQSKFDSTEPFGPEPFGSELKAELLTADGLVAGQIPKSKFVKEPTCAFVHPVQYTVEC